MTPEGSVVSMARSTRKCSAEGHQNCQGSGFEKDLGNFGKLPKSTTWSFFPYGSERSKKMKVHPSFSDKPFNFGQAKYQVLTAKRATQKRVNR
jgi:hypothetical protein